jgi:hypothetical protein
MSHVDWFLLEARIVRSSHIATSGLKREFVDDRLGVKLDRSDVAARHNSENTGATRLRGSPFVGVEIYVTDRFAYTEFVCICMDDVDESGVAFIQRLGLVLLL